MKIMDGFGSDFYLHHFIFYTMRLIKIGIFQRGAGVSAFISRIFSNQICS